MAKKVKNFILPNGEEIDISGANEDLSNLSSAGQAKLNAKANDSTVVHKTGNETVAGTKTFSSTISGSVSGSAEFSKYLGNHKETVSSSIASAPSAGMAKTSGLFLTGTYNDSATPASYGNIINIAGNGSGQLLCEWSGTDNTTGNVYYRSHRDTSTGGWGAWKKLAFTTDNVTSATKATQDSSGQQIDTTYIKGVTASNATITVTKGNGTTSTATINNVANATNATKATQDGNGNNIVNTYATKTSLNTKADLSLSNITDAGKQVIKDNSGGWNPPLLSSFWADHLLNRMDMLRADTFSWQDGNTYSLVYNELLSEYNNSASVTKTERGITYKRTPKGYKIALASQETAIVNKYNSDGIAWYYILDNGDSSAEGGLPDMGDTTNKRFKLPRTKFGFEGIRTSVGDDIKESLPNIKGTFRGTGQNSSSSDSYEGGAFNAIAKGTGFSSASGNDVKAWDFNASRSSSTYQDGAPVQERATQMYLYFYVGGFTKSAEAQTAGLKAEQLNSKVDTSSLVECQVVTETYVNDTSGYRIWSDGYCEQWGSFGEAYTGYKTKTITFLKNFKDTNYCLIHTMSGTGNQYAGVTYTKTTTNFSVINSLNYNNLACWKACGYLAEGEY